MALVDVHPDYLSFDNQSKRRVYPAEKYAELLGYLAERYRGEFWNVTPSELAAWYRRTSVGRDSGIHKRFAGKKASVLLYSEYKSDARPRREAEALVKSGMEVDVICLRQNPADPKTERISGVEALRPRARTQYAGCAGFQRAFLKTKRRQDLVGSA